MVAFPSHTIDIGVCTMCTLSTGAYACVCIFFINVERVRVKPWRRTCPAQTWFTRHFLVSDRASTLDYGNGWMVSKEIGDIYSTNESQVALNSQGIALSWNVQWSSSVPSKIEQGEVKFWKEEGERERGNSRSKNLPPGTWISVKKKMIFNIGC